MDGRKYLVHPSIGNISCSFAETPEVVFQLNVVHRRGVLSSLRKKKVASFH